jgi:hypothetical protein
MANRKNPRSDKHTLLRQMIPPLMGLALVVLLLPGMGFAQDAISEVTVIYGGSAGILPPEGFTKINIDLNWGAGGDFIYVCYKRGVGTPITGLAVTLDGGSPPAGYAWTRIDVDLNRNAGGDFIWLWYTKDPACTTVKDLVVLVNAQATPDDYTKINVDLNRNAGGEYLYFAYLKN